MAPIIARVRAVELLAPAPRDLQRGEGALRVSLEEGGECHFPALTPNHVAARMNESGQDFSYGVPSLFVRSFDPESLGVAVGAMAADMSGFWLRYYNSKPPASKGRKAKKSAVKLRVDAIEINEFEPAQNPGHCSAVVQVSLADGRQFSILAATPSWFTEAFSRIGLRFYFGPLILFARAMDPGILRRAVADMIKPGDQWLCRYDTPRTNLTKVLSEFKDRHP